MKFTEQRIKGVWVIEPEIHADERGYFMEAYKKASFEQQIGKIDFIQDNESKSIRGVLRGLHYQTGSFSQAKLVRVLSGSVLDVAVDIRKSSPTFGQYVAVKLTGDNKQQLFIPRGFAHGFLVLSNEAVFSYKVDNIYSATHEASILWNDPAIGVDWGQEVAGKDLILSAKDKSGKLLSDAILFE